MNEKDSRGYDTYLNRIIMDSKSGFKKSWGSFADIFKDKNDINEKSVVGFIAFTIMVIFAFSDIIAAYIGIDLEITEFIYNSFTMITLGCFGIAEAGRIFTRSNSTEAHYQHHQYENDDTNINVNYSNNRGESGGTPYEDDAAEIEEYRKHSNR